MVNFGLLAAEILSLVWDTTANFNGFRVLAALLHGTVGASAKLCGFEQRAPPVFGRAAITLGIGPHSSCFYEAASAVEFGNCSTCLSTAVCRGVPGECCAGL